MFLKNIVTVAGLAIASVGIMAIGNVQSANAAACGAAWASPGTYKITGNFRGKPESAGAELTLDCRIDLKIPGVYTGGRVKKSGDCLRFTFKIDKEKALYKGTWCDGYAVVDWKGNNVRATVKSVRQGAK